MGKTTARKSKHVSRKRADEAVEELSPALRKKGREWLNMKIRQRRGSETYGDGHPQIAVDDKQLALMLRFSNGGLSHRVIERVMHLLPQSGMDSHRCVTRAKGTSKAKARKSKARKTKSKAAVAAA